MSIKQSDNFYSLHPKPLQEYERKLTGVNYIDYTDTTEVMATIPIDYRKNKYFWIAGALFQCDNDGITFRSTSEGGGVVRGPVDFTGGYFDAVI